jgi:hypothetical protein
VVGSDASSDGDGFKVLKMSFNPVSTIRTEPELTLAMLQEVTQMELSHEQLVIAIGFIAELPADTEVTLLDLFQLWDGSPALSGFARALKRNCLPE